MCRVPCSNCGGRGKITCYHCGSHGVEYVYDEDEEREIPYTCPKCDGSGVIECSSCWGRGDIPDRY